MNKEILKKKIRKKVKKRKIEIFFSIFKSVKSLASGKENVRLKICWTSGPNMISRLMNTFRLMNKCTTAIVG